MIKNINSLTLPKFISSGLFLNLYSSFILIDYLNDRTLFIESFLNIEFKLNLTNLSVLKPNEAGLGILLIIFLYLKNNLKIKYFYFIIPGLTIAFLITESRSFGLGFILFVLFYAIKDTKKLFTILFGLVLGVLISFQISYIESEKILSLIGQNETEKIYPDEVGYKRFRQHNFYETKYRYLSLFSQNQNTEIKEIQIDTECPNNVDFRRSLWSAGLDDLVQNKSSIFFGKGVGFGIPNYLYSNGMLNDCFKPLFESNKPLRSLHNSFLTLLYRFGLLFYLL